MLVENLKKYSYQLYKEGEKVKAAKIILDTYQEFSNLPEYELNFKESSYWLALAGDWNKALTYANLYLNNKKNKKYVDDMTYLLAKSQEKTLDFYGASKNYYNIASRYPDHKKSSLSYKRSEILAYNEDDIALAVKANVGFCPLLKESIARAKCCLRR